MSSPIDVRRCEPAPHTSGLSHDSPVTEGSSMSSPREVERTEPARQRLPRRARTRGLSASAASTRGGAASQPSQPQPPLACHAAAAPPTPHITVPPLAPQHLPLPPSARSDGGRRAETAEPWSVAPSPSLVAPSSSPAPLAPAIASQPASPVSAASAPQPQPACQLQPPPQPAPTAIAAGPTRVISHAWSSDAAARQPRAPSAPASDDIEHLRALAAGKPIPRQQRAPPADASHAWAGEDLGAPRAAVPVRVLVLFAGPCEAESHLPGHLRAAGCVVHAVDTKLGGASHDVLRSSVGTPILEDVRAGRYDAVFVATPCSSYSVRHDPPLRDCDQPEGLLPLPEGWGAYINKHNRLAEFTARVLDACSASATPAALENPADRADDESRAHWPAFSRHGSLWRMPSITAALGAATPAFTPSHSALLDPQPRSGPPSPASGACVERSLASTRHASRATTAGRHTRRFSPGATHSDAPARAWLPPTHGR